MTRSGTRGAMPPIPNMPSWRDAQLKHSGKFYLKFGSDISTCLMQW